MSQAANPDRTSGQTWSRRIAAALLPFLLAGCGAQDTGTQDTSTQARPAMWIVADDDTRIFLLGTMHALPRGTDWDEGKVAEAIRDADELVMELSPNELAQTGEIFQALAPRTAPLAMGHRLEPGTLAHYRALEAKGGSFGGDALDDWAVMVLMGQRTAQQAGLSPADGVEKGLTAAFRKAGKPIGGLERAEAQLMMFETLDAVTQRSLLTRAAEQSGDAVAKAGALTSAWSRGDIAALETMINDDIDAVPAARKALLTDRNRRWSQWIVTRLEKPGTVLVAVGAGHLVGRDGVPTMLEAEGITVTRVQ